MKKVTPLLLLCLLLTTFIGCEKLDVPTPTQEEFPLMPEKEDSTNTSPEDENDTIGNDTTEHAATINDTIRYVQIHGDEDTPFTVHDFKTYIPAYFAYAGGATGMQEVCVCGYIVGYIKGSSMSNTIFAAGDVETNIVLADVPTERDYNNCIPVQLTTSSPHSLGTRKALNLSTHPENLGKKVIVLGNITTYMRTLGIKNARDYEILENDQ